jgi:hypothetical protein
MKSLNVLTVCLTAVLLGGCATSGAVTSLGYCEVSRPILVSKSDLFTDDTARQILTHNEVWAWIWEKKR